jgi:DNA-binding transcriptional LysR family regulator
MRTIDLEALLIFRTVVSEGGVNRAAEKLHRVPSNVTTRVRQLEEYLGVRLFRRDGRTLSLTAEGRTLLNYATRLPRLADEAVDALRTGKPQGACVAAGTGFAVVPKSVLGALQAADKVREHKLPERIAANCTHLVWRGQASLALEGLIALLTSTVVPAQAGTHAEAL